MKPAACLTAIAIALILVSAQQVRGETAALMGMANLHRQDVNRVTFAFDRVPQFDLSTSGQRVRIVFYNAELSGSFNDIPDREMVFPLMRSEVEEQGNNIVADLYFRDIPEFVDASYGDGYGRVSLNVFWSRKGRRSRPAIHDQKMGRLRPIREGSVAEEIIASDYRGRWVDFFREFEWKPSMDLPVSFSLPDLPGPLAEETGQDPDLEEALEGGLEDRAAEIIKDRLSEDLPDKEADLYRLLLAHCLLLQGKQEEAGRAAGRAYSEEAGDRISCWAAYFKARALAGRQKIFQAARVLEQSRSSAMQAGDLAPWYALLESEIELAAGNNEQAIDLLKSEKAESRQTEKIAALRRADAHFAGKREERAYQIYKDRAEDLPLLQKYPESLANWAMLLYRRQQYESSYRYLFLLSETLGGDQPGPARLADYWAAMAMLRADSPDRARLMLWETDERAAGREAGFRAWLKLIDMDILDAEEPDFDDLVHEYDPIIEESDTRQVREEAFFKKILAYHLAGDDFSAVKFLGRFFDQYWGGPLQPEARALFVEIFPQVAERLVEKEAFFEALTLVKKHRDLLAQAGITYDFLHDLAESYEKSGFLERAAETYLYILDFEGKEEKKKSVYLPLVRVYHSLGEFGSAERYGLQYLEQHPEGRDREEILYFYADCLAETDRTEQALRLLHENKRPRNARLDYLTGKLFYSRERWEQAWRYLSRAAEAGYEEKSHEIDFKRAEAAFRLMQWQKAAAVYSRLLDVSEYAGQAGFRMIQIYSDLGDNSRALNLYEQLAEREIEDRWLELAAETVEIENRIK